jgi:hypothetical protein
LQLSKLQKVQEEIQVLVKRIQDAEGEIILFHLKLLDSNISSKLFSVDVQYTTSIIGLSVSTTGGIWDLREELRHIQYTN